MTFPSFEAFFKAVSGFDPYVWQQDLAVSFLANRAPASIGVDTGMGKTQIVTAWLWSLASQHSAGTARTVQTRLHFVVDRRILVDDTAVMGERLAELLASSTHPDIVPVAKALKAAGGGEQALLVKRLRGGLPRKPEHVSSPAAPALITSTIDLFASRLLWRGYGVSHGRRPIDAALTGIDTLIVLDEAHLATQLSRTLEILDIQNKSETGFGTIPLRQTITMSATGKNSGADIFDRASEVRAQPSLAKRFSRRDSIPVRHLTLAERSSADQIAAAAAAHALGLNLGAGQSAVIFVNTVKSAKIIHDKLTSALAKISNGAASATDTALLIGGTAVPYQQTVMERLSPYRTGAKTRSTARPLIVVATQTLEVGADLDFDHLVTESTALDSFIQRSGRVNRVGARNGGTITLWRTPDFATAATLGPKAKLDPVYREAEVHTHAAISALTSAGNTVLADIKALSGAELAAPKPDALTLSKPFFEDYLVTRGIVAEPNVSTWIRPADRSQSSVQVVFRKEVDLEVPDLVLAELLATKPPASWETWTVPLSSVTDLEVLTKPVVKGAHGLPPRYVVIEPTMGRPTAQDYRVLSYRDPATLAIEAGSNGTILIVGERVDAFGIPGAGSDVSGEQVTPLTGTAVQAATEDDALIGRPAASVAREVIDNEGPTGWFIAHTPAAYEDSASCRQSLADHGADVAQVAHSSAQSLGLPADIVDAITLAARHHDDGKSHPAFQRQLSYMNVDGTLVFEPSSEKLGKSATLASQHGATRLLGGVERGFRHEGYSVSMNRVKGVVLGDLVEYLIATHHGHFRGIAPTLHEPERCRENESQAPNVLQDASTADWAQWPALVKRLQAEHGPYTLALAETVLRLADHHASAQNDQNGDAQ